MKITKITLKLAGYLLAAIASVTLIIPFTGCQQSSDAGNVRGKTIVVTYSIMGSLVKDLVGDNAEVIISIPNGLDPHEWEPSAKDIESINKADLVIQNGLGLEHGLEKVLESAKYNGVKIFTASDFITKRYIGSDDVIHNEEHDHAAGAADPHYWMDPLAMKSVIHALVKDVNIFLNLDVSRQAAEIENRLEILNDEISSITEFIPSQERKLVTGHESMGYFAQRYGFETIGVIVPGLSTQAGVSAGDLAVLKQSIEENRVKAIFTEVGTSPSVAKAIGTETGVKVTELTTHCIPSDGSYYTFMRNLANVIVNALK
jgi:zinc/manganese transport system substrate-binding protein